MNTWEEFFASELHKKSIRNLVCETEHDYRDYILYPQHSNVLEAFKLTPYNDVKAVIIGQDPYHEPGQAMGLSFSVPVGAKIPPSLRNIFKEYQSDLGYDIPSSGDLTKWAKNGVLLLNSILTVKKGEPLSCNYREYQVLFSDIIKFLAKRRKPMVFILWGKSAQSCERYINNETDRHLVLKASHPSPLSSYRNFFGTKPMSRTNEFLLSQKQEPIDWKL